MTILYVATSKILQEWGADVGLGKNLYKVGLAEETSPAEAVAGLAGKTDWKILKMEEDVSLTEDLLLERLARRQKVVDPTYYPALRGATGIVKVSLPAVENSRLIALALEGKEPPKTFKTRPVDVAQYLLENAIK